MSDDADLTTRTASDDIILLLHFCNPHKPEDDFGLSGWRDAHDAARRLEQVVQAAYVVVSAPTATAERVALDALRTMLGVVT